MMSCSKIVARWSQDGARESDAVRLLLPSIGRFPFGCWQDTKSMGIVCRALLIASYEILSFEMGWMLALWDVSTVDSI